MFLERLQARSRVFTVFAWIGVFACSNNRKNIRNIFKKTRLLQLCRFQQIFDYVVSSIIVSTDSIYIENLIRVNELSFCFNW